MKLLWYLLSYVCHKLTSEASSKYLGVELHSDMSWRSHIDKTVKKANSTLGFLRRNLKVSNQDMKTAAYKTLVRPTIEYCSSVWSPHTKDAINKIEMVKRRAARYVTNRYRNTSSITSMLGDLEWDTLETRRKKIRLTMMYKIINNLIDIRAEEYLTKQDLAIPWSTNSSQHPQITTNTVSSHRPPVFGIPCQHQLLRLPVWYLSNRSCPLPLSKLRVVKL